MKFNFKTEHTYYEAPDGEMFDLDDWSESFLTSESGNGMADIEYRTTRGPFQDGESLVDFKLTTRLIQYASRVQTKNRSAFWTKRARMLDTIRPNRQNINSLQHGKLTKILSNGDKRALNVLVAAGPSFQSDNKDWDMWGSNEVIRFVAHDPLWFDPDVVSVSFSAAIPSNLVFPITFPITFGASLLDDVENVVYAGTWKTFPIIEITGPLGNLILTNNATGEIIELLYNIPAGRVVTINLAYGLKSVVDDLGVSLEGTVTPESDKATWHLATEPEAVDGINEIRVQGASIVPGTTAVVLRYYTRYIGI
jgi:hypothetical protein